MTSSLALKKSDFESEVGDYMGWGRDPEAWVGDKLTRVRMDTASGLRRFYFAGHPWSFLKPTETLTLVTGATTLLLPDNFCGVDGGTKVSISQASDGLSRFQLEFTGVGRVIQALALTPTATGVPQMIAQRPLKAIAAGQMQRSELLVYPIPEQDYTLKIPYLIAPNYLLDVTQPYAYGGLEHHETILECCLAAAEQRRDKEFGIHSQKADDLLQKSIRMDQRKQPIKLGLNLDRSDNMVSVMDSGPWNGHGWAASQGVNIDGVLYD